MNGSARILGLVGMALAGGLFAWKYASRLGIGPLLSVPAYLLAFLAVVLAPGRLRGRFQERPFLLVFLYCLPAVPLFLRIDPLSLQVDRWSALENFIRACLHGEFPYGAPSHLGHPISGFPMLFLSALPFHFLGNVGWMQFAALAAFAALAVRAAGRRQAGAAVLLLLAQPGFQFEVFARSDLFANMVLAAWGMEVSIRSREDRSGGRLLGEAALWGTLLATRGIVAVPFLLRAGSLLRGEGIARTAAFGLASGAVAASSFLPFYLMDPAAFRAHNPFLVQAGYLPPLLFLPVAAAAFFAGCADPGGARKFRNAGLLIFAIVAACFLRAAIGRGWEDAVYGSGFDISYFTLALPFLILARGETR